MESVASPNNEKSPIKNFGSFFKEGRGFKAGLSSAVDRAKSTNGRRMTQTPSRAEIEPYRRSGADMNLNFKSLVKSNTRANLTTVPRREDEARKHKREKELRKHIPDIFSKQERNLTDMVSKAINNSIDDQFEPTNVINEEIDLTRYTHKNIAEKYDFVNRKDENKSPFRNYSQNFRGAMTNAVEAAVTGRPSRVSTSPSPGDNSGRSHYKPDQPAKSYLTSISSTFRADDGRSCMVRYFLAICGDPVSINA